MSQEGRAGPGNPGDPGDPGDPGAPGTPSSAGSALEQLRARATTDTPNSAANVTVPEERLLSGIGSGGSPNLVRLRDIGSNRSGSSTSNRSGGAGERQYIPSNQRTQPTLLEQVIGTPKSKRSTPSSQRAGDAAPLGGEGAAPPPPTTDPGTRPSPGAPPSPPPNPLKKPFDPKDPEYDVNQILEHTGWGWYQHKVIFVMGIMSFADAAEIWLATIILKNLVCEWSLSAVEKALIPAVVYFFYAIGSIVSGKLADKFGRFPVMLVNSYILVISAICSALAPSYYFFIVCRSITGFCIGGNYGTSIVYSSEMVPVDKRAWNIMILEFYWTLGSVYECVVAFFVMDLEGGWRIQILLTAVPCVVMLILMHFMDESPRYLTINNLEEKAMVVVVKMCEQNGMDVPEGRLICSDTRSGEYVDLYAKPYTRGSILISINFFCNMYLVFAICMLIPDMMTYGYCYLDAWFDITYVNETGCTVYTKAEYLFLIVVAVMFAPGFVLGSLGAETIGRKKTFYLTVYIGAAFTVFLLFCFSTVVSYIDLAVMVVSFSAYNEVLWIYTPEYYPTYMRAMAVGVQNGIGKFGAAGGTFITEYLDSYDVTYSIYCFIVIVAIACVSILFLDRETMGEELQDSRVHERTALFSRASQTGASLRTVESR